MSFIIRLCALRFVSWTSRVSECVKPEQVENVAQPWKRHGTRSLMDSHPPSYLSYSFQGRTKSSDDKVELECRPHTPFM